MRREQNMQACQEKENEYSGLKQNLSATYEPVE